MTLAVSVIAHLVILVFEHVFAPSPTRHHELATQTIRTGAYSRLFWGGAIIGGGVLPVLMLLTLGATFSPVVGIAASVLALAGGAAWEYIWVEAGQSVPLS
jgi:formate-dependent nitrite reductase membrane component NrfD